MQPHALRHPQTFLAVTRVVAFCGLIFAGHPLPLTVIVPAVVYAIAACTLGILDIRRPPVSPLLIGGTAAGDVAWFMVVVLYLGPLNALPAIVFTVIVAAVVAAASSTIAVGVGLLAALAYYALSVAYHGAELQVGEGQVLAYQAVMIALAGTLTGYISGQLSQLQKTRAMAERLERLNAATAEMTAVSGDAHLIRGALSHAAEIIGGDRLWVMLADPARHLLRLDGHIGASPSAATPITCPDDQGIAGRVVQAGAPLMIQGAADREPDLPPLEAEFIQQHVLAVPISDNGSVAGVLLVSGHRNHPFTDADLALSAMLGRFLGRALHTSRLIRSLHQAAITDSLTGLYNHETFLAKLGEQIAEAGKTGEAVSLIVLDMDDFKRVNDTAGHWAGDRVLKALAETLRRECRSADTIGRYGGDEFAVVLPGIGREEAAVIARRASTALRASGEELDLPIPITASWGIASFPWDGVNDEQLFRRADARLYEAKEAGGDRVTFESAVA